MVGRLGELLRAIGPGTTSTRQVIKSIKPPYVFQLQTQNEWSTRMGGQVLGLTSSINAAVPGLAQFSLPIAPSVLSAALLKAQPIPGQGQATDPLFELKELNAEVERVALKMESALARLTKREL